MCLSIILRNAESKNPCRVTKHMESKALTNSIEELQFFSMSTEIHPPRKFYKHRPLLEKMHMKVDKCSAEQDKLPYPLG